MPSLRMELLNMMSIYSVEFNLSDFTQKMSYNFYVMIISYDYLSFGQEREKDKQTRTEGWSSYTWFIGKSGARAGLYGMGGVWIIGMREHSEVSKKTEKITLGIGNI